MISDTTEGTEIFSLTYPLLSALTDLLGTREEQAMSAIIYCRVSTDSQAEKGISLDAQVAACTAYAQAHGLEVVDVIVDAGLSGKSTDRPGLQKLLKLVVLNLRLNGLFFSDYLGRHSLFSCCLDRAGQPGSAFGD